MTKNFDNAQDQKIHEVLVEVYNALDEKGYKAVEQIIGYLYTNDLTYITPYKGARKLLQELDRDDVMHHIAKYYFET